MSVTGLNELLNNFNILKDNVQKSIVDSFKESTKKIENKAKENSPEETGKLKKQIKSVVKIKKDKIVAMVGVKGGKDSAYYGFFVHEGTIYIKKRDPFLQDAYEDFKNEIENDVIKRLKEGMKI